METHRLKKILKKMEAKQKLAEYYRLYLFVLLKRKKIQLHHWIGEKNK